MRSNATDKQGADKNSLRLIWITIAVSTALAVYVSFNYYFPIAHFNFIKYIGLAIIFTGILMRLIIIKSLGKFFTADVTIRQGHELKKDGFYKFLRHPSYFASLLSFIGFAISLNNLVSLLIVVAAILSAFINRIKVEERTLIDYFGQEYVDYKKTTKRLIPFVY